MTMIDFETAKLFVTCFWDCQFHIVFVDRIQHRVRVYLFDIPLRKFRGKKSEAAFDFYCVVYDREKELGAAWAASTDDDQ
jgi:hypothetical protein